MESILLPNCIQPEWTMAAADLPPLASSPLLSPNDISPHRSVGSCRQGGAPRPPSPQIPRRTQKKNKKAKRERKHNTERRRKHRPRHIPPWRRPSPGLSLTNSLVGGPGPPSSPSTSTLSSPEPSSPPSSPASPRGGMVTICPTSPSE